jgi:hypothetical protein
MLIAGAVIVLSACSSGSPTQAPGAATQAPGQTAGGGGGGSGATEPPAATTDSGGGGGGGVGTGSGSIHVEITGPMSKTLDLAFVPPGSLFGGLQGSSFSFTDDAANDVATVNLTSDGKFVILVGNPDFAAPAVECTPSNLKVDASSASASFECDNAMVITSAGASLTGATIKGSFTAHA